MVRDSNGLVIASMAQQLPQAYKAVEIEAMAVSRASEFWGGDWHTPGDPRR